MSLLQRGRGGSDCRRLAAAGILMTIFLCTARESPAATPGSGTISSSNPSVTWTGALIAGTNNTEGDCVEGVTCDTYVLTLAPGDYTGKRITVAIGWTNPASDMDLYVHSASPTGPIAGQSNDFVPDTEERTYISIDPPIVTTARVYYAHAVAFAVTVPGYNGEAAIVNAPSARVPVYTAGALSFSQNVSLRIPVAASDGEPSVRVDVRGNCYVGAIRGVPAGVDLWRFDLNPTSPMFDPGMQNPTYLGQPDAFLPQDPEDPTAGGADGGGDIDIACSFPTNPDSTPVVTIVSLAAANISSAYSFDRGETFTLSPLTAVVPADDRQWVEANGENTVYMLYRAPIPATGLFVQRSDDHGLTYPATGLVSPSGTSPGYIDVNHTTGRVYAAHESSNELQVASSIDGGLTWKNTIVDNSTGHDQLFDVVKVGDDGTVYAAWSNGTNIYMAHSTDHGVSWSSAIRVNDNSVYKTNLFPWIEAGSAGRVAIVWYGSTHNTNNNDADWEVLFSQCLNFNDTNPVFAQQVISDHIIHGSNISTGGLTGADNRNLIDYFQVAIDPQGAAVVAFTDDHNDYEGHTRVTRQLNGPSLYATANGSGTVTPATPPPLPEPDPSEPEVSDYLHDAVGALLQPITTDNPYDILWVDYSCSDSLPDPLYLVARMKVSSLAAIPETSNWMVNFTAHAPGGVSDRGDQFFVRANTDNAAVPTFTWGTTERTGSSDLEYTDRGAAAGSFDTANGIITLKAPIEDMNAYVTHGPPITFGTVFHGLRGRAFTDEIADTTSAIRDVTRGGTSFTFPPCGPRSAVPGDPHPGGPVAAFVGAPRPNPTSKSASVTFEVARGGHVELGIFDVSGRRVRSIVSAMMAPGEYTRTWDGRTDRFADAPGGIYFFVLNTSDGVRSEKVMLAR